MSEQALGQFLDKQDRHIAEDECWCQGGRHWVPASEMRSEFAYDCKACEAKIAADNEEAERWFVEFGGEL